MLAVAFFYYLFNQSNQDNTLEWFQPKSPMTESTSTRRKLDWWRPWRTSCHSWWLPPKTLKFKWQTTLSSAGWSQLVDQVWKRWHGRLIISSPGGLVLIEISNVRSCHASSKCSASLRDKKIISWFFELLLHAQIRSHNDYSLFTVSGMSSFKEKDWIWLGIAKQ